MNSVTLDIRTLAFVLVLVSAILSLLMLFIWRTNKTYPGFGFWTLANLAGAAGFLLIGLRGIAPDALTIIVGNTLTVGCMALMLKGIRTFFGRSSSAFFCITALTLQAALMVYFTYVSPDVTARIYIASALAVILSARCAYEFLNLDKEERLFTTSFGATIFGLFAMFMVARISLTYSFSHINDLYSPDWIQSLTFTMFILFVMIWTVDFIMLNSERLQRELQIAQVELEKIATTDFLTGINNSRSFTEISENEVRRAMRFRHSLCVIMLDIDHFKQINDTYGHATGDMVLKKVVEIGRVSLRGIDTFGRLGGEEFGILLPHTDIAGAITVAEHLRGVIEKAEIKTHANSIKITASFGVTEFRRGDAGVKSVLERVDALLYEAKHAGRNCYRSDSKIPTNLRLVSQAQI